MSKQKNLNILLVEDNEGDIVLTQEAFKEAGIECSMNIVRDGEEAISYLENARDGVQQPSLVLLDINLPKVNGLQVLKFIKKDKVLRRMVVVMLSTSSYDKDIDNSYDGFANSYITKPSDLSSFVSTIGKIKDYWLNIAQIPFAT